MKAIEIRRGDHFTKPNGRTYVALLAARLDNALPRVRVHVIEVADRKMSHGEALDLGAAKTTFTNFDLEDEVEIHQRDLPIHHSSDEAIYTDKPNMYLGGMTDRELDASQLRESIPKVVATIENLGSERDLLVRRGLAAGISAIELAKLTGLSRARIYQIRDDRR